MRHFRYYQGGFCDTNVPSSSCAWHWSSPCLPRSFPVWVSDANWEETIFHCQLKYLEGTVQVSSASTKILFFFSHGREINKKLNVRKWDFKGRLCREGLRTSQRNTHNKKGSQQQLLDQQMYTFHKKGAQYILAESFWIPCVPCVPGPDWECAHSYRYGVA